MFDRYNIMSGADVRAAGELLQAFATAKPKNMQKEGPGAGAAVQEAGSGGALMLRGNEGQSQLGET